MHIQGPAGLAQEARHWASLARALPLERRKGQSRYKSATESQGGFWLVGLGRKRPVAYSGDVRVCACRLRPSWGPLDQGDDVRHVKRLPPSGKDEHTFA